MEQVNEFSMNLPMVGVPSNIDITACTTLPPDVDPSACEHITVYVDSAQAVNYDPDSPTVLIDLMLSVQITDPVTGTGKNYKMVKRLGMDKCKLACDAENMTGVQFVESLEDDQADVEKMMEQFYAAKRAREVAGLAESAGTKKFKVQFQYDDRTREGKSTAVAGGAIIIDAVKDKAHARHVFDVKYGNNKKYPNAKITRVTEISATFSEDLEGASRSVSSRTWTVPERDMLAKELGKDAVLVFTRVSLDPQLSMLTHNGGGVVDNHHFAYIKGTDELIRVDAARMITAARKAAKKD